MAYALRLKFCAHSQIGNYLRAEILHRCAISPFKRARDVLLSAMEDPDTGLFAVTTVGMSHTQHLIA